MQTSTNTGLSSERSTLERAGPQGPAVIWPLPPRLLAEIEFEGAAWAEITALAEQLTADERLAPGYFLDPPWSVRDLVGHLAAWHAEAREQLLDIGARSYQPHDVDIDQRNAAVLPRLRDRSWDEVWDEARNTRAWMLEVWHALHEPDDEAAEWVRKAGAEHYAEHLPRLRAWVAELIDLRTRPRLDERDP